MITWSSRARLPRAVGIVVTMWFGCNTTPEPAPAAPAAPSAPAPNAAAAKPQAPTREPGPGATATPRAVASSPCASICARSQELKCERAAECASICAQSMVDNPCTAQMNAATACMVARGINDWECTPEGLAAIKPGHCDAEQELFAKCLTAMPKSP